MNIDIHAAAAEVVTAFVDAGIRATLDPRDANPPCVIVREQTITPARLDGWEVVWQLDLIAGDPGLSAVSRGLSDLFADVTEVIPIDSATRVDLLLPGSPDPTPAYRVLVTTSVTD
jgi:hypothetical protein